MRKRKKKFEESPLELYTQMAEQRLADGAYDKRKDTSSDKITVGYKKIFSPNSVKVVYNIKATDTFIDAGMINKLRQGVERYGVCMNAQIKMSPYSINWDDPNIKNQRANAMEFVDNMSQTKSTNFNTMAERKEFERSKRLYQSYGYYGSVEERQRKLCICEISLELERVKGDKIARRNFKIAQKEIRSYLKNIKVENVKGRLMEYLEYHSPVSNKLDGKSFKDGRFILSDEIVARMIGYYGGDIGDRGIPLGRDIATNKLVYKNLISNTGSAENFIVMGETGAGKSAAMKALAQMILASLINLVILDIDGEYTYFTEENDGVVISFSKSYFDTMEISNPTGVPEVDSNLFYESRKATLNMFSCLMSLEKGMSDNEKLIFSKVYNRVLEEAGVIKEDMHTWGKSKGLSYHDIYYKAKEMCTEEDAQHIRVTLADMHSFVNKLSHYFEPDGLYSHLFSNKISINEILERNRKQATVVDIVLNLDKIAVTQEELVEQVIKQTSACYLCNVLSNYFKSIGQFTTEIIEEYNRYASVPQTSTMVLTLFTGNRKKNVNAILVTNSPMDLIKSSSVASYAVVDNVRNYIVGALKPKTIEAVCEVFNLEYCQGLLSKISTNPRYKFCFLVKLDDNSCSVVKRDIPEDLLETKLFKTRDTKRTTLEREDIEWSDFRDEALKKREAGRKLNRTIVEKQFLD